MKDLRYQKTKTAILRAIEKLLQNKDFEKISIKDICEEAQVSRSAFYLHYTDKYDLAKQCQLELIETANMLIKERVIVKRKDLMLTMLNLLLGKERVMALLISSHGSSEIQENIRQVMRENMRKNILPLTDLKFEGPTEERYFLSFFSNALFGIIQEWINSGQKESPEEIVALVDKNFLFEFK
ncbi:TetR/AcrR family transcriptional regulator [Liquorilactobacillus mali]|nr:TetR/AcrR family transcriptional regulator [Liquorilactobacillus mali]EJE97558.1 TetR family transcriptional regulator [Liquorilactobacillus mali KCTC 3596 = DSM 20444]KRN08858.1 TetR family transcriptional regulator [Liquorilactobacillus mali KCTC 3596 = DSM 20444]MDC7952975.1 TetR/AcrR family transcriptional regulator [Liquorilactobacillus mali]MDN7146117.1 TetR/AcrR family transcriptional regulator [Liquorilactobacillus mali]MDV7758806.1 TetR family transcriptional regulator [Liquorilact